MLAGVLLIVTNRRDLTADWLIGELHRRDVPFVRFNTEDYPAEVALRWSPEVGATLRLSDRELALSDVTAVWYRRPVPPSLDARYEQPRAEWARDEAMEALDAVLRTIRGVWVNHPDQNRAASLKSAQLEAARALGFRIPQTVITNDPAAARELVANARDGAIVKPVRQGRIRRDGYDELFFTSEITDSDALDRLGAEPYVFQELIHKTADIRVTVIGDSVLPVRIDSQRDARARVDFRRVDPAELAHEPMQLGAEEAGRCRELVRSFGCLFGAIDLLETAEGELVFLENNPNGQWAWLEQRCEVPLRSRLADLLLAK